MNPSIVPHLVKKDFLILRKTIIGFCLVSLTAIVITSLLFERIPNWAFVNLAFMLLIAPAAACGIVLLMRSIVMEKVKSTQSFIMSLPVTVKEFTLAKVLVNLPIFTAFWVATSSVTFYFAFGLGIFPYGAIPFVSMILLGVFVAYICILSTSLLFQSHGITILSILIFEMGTSAYLWVVVYLDPIANYIYGQTSVWNSTAIGIITTQVLIAIFMLLMTMYVQNKKRDFI